jgi:hypothetical protein
VPEVDVYHELAQPYEVMQRVRDSLNPDGRVAFVEYRKEDPNVPIKEVHKMSVAQLENEMRPLVLFQCAESKHCHCKTSLSSAGDSFGN